MVDQPKEDLFDLDALSVDSSAGVPDPFFQEESEVIEDGEKYVVFEIDKKNYAIPSEQVAEVVRMIPVTVIPNIPGWFMGIANLRGDILSVLDLSGVLHKEPSNPNQKAKLVVLNSDDSDTNIAFRVDRLREIAVLNDEQIKEPADQHIRHFAGVANHKSLEINVLDVAEIISSLALR